VIQEFKEFKDNKVFKVIKEIKENKGFNTLKFILIIGPLYVILYVSLKDYSNELLF